MKINEVTRTIQNTENGYEISIYFDEITAERYSNGYHTHYYIYILTDNSVLFKKLIYKNSDYILSKEYTIRQPNLIEKLRNLDINDLIKTPEKTYKLIQGMFNSIAPLFEPYEELLEGDA